MAWSRVWVSSTGAGPSGMGAVRDGCAAGVWLRGLGLGRRASAGFGIGGGVFRAGAGLPGAVASAALLSRAEALLRVVVPDWAFARGDAVSVRLGEVSPRVGTASTAGLARDGAASTAGLARVEVDLAAFDGGAGVPVRLEAA